MQATTRMTGSTLDLLRRFDTPTICNVIELFDVRPRDQGYMDHRIMCAFPELRPMVGFAATAGFRSAGPPSATDVYGSLEDQIELFEGLDGPPVVVYQDLDDPPAAAVFGEVMCTTYRAFGAAGLVTNGAGRDLDQVRELDFPVFTGVDHQRPRLLPHPSRRRAGARGRPGCRPGRSAPWRPQRRDQHPPSNRLRGGGGGRRVRRGGGHRAGLPQQPRNQDQEGTLRGVCRVPPGGHRTCGRGYDGAAQIPEIMLSCGQFKLSHPGSLRTALSYEACDLDALLGQSGR